MIAKPPLLALLTLGPALLSGCPQETLSLGRYDSDAAPGREPDGGTSIWPAPDGSPPAQLDGAAGSTIALSLEVAGRTQITRLSASCAATCIAVRLQIEGGVPPYDVRWDDGERGVERELCVDALHTRSVAVSDASNGQNGPASLAIPPVTYTYEACDLVGNDERWTVCHKHQVTPITCPKTSQGSGLGIDLGEQGDGQTWISSSFVVQATDLNVPALDVYTSSQPCGEDYLYISSGFSALEGSDPVRMLLAISNGQTVTDRYLLWYAYDYVTILPGLPLQRVPLELPTDLAFIETELCEWVVPGA